MEQMYTFAIFRPMIEFMYAFSLSLVVWFGGRLIIENDLSIGGLLSSSNSDDLLHRGLRLCTMLSRRTN